MAEKRRKKGEGHWRITNTGKIEYRFRYTDEYGRKKYKSVTGVDEDHCYERADEFLYKLEQKMNGRDLDATIVQLVREKIDNDYKKNFTGEQGYNRNLKTLTIIERSMIGFMPIADIQPYHLENFLHYITKYANNTISKVYAMVKLAYNIAIEKEIVKVDLTKHRDLKCP